MHANWFYGCFVVILYIVSVLLYSLLLAFITINKFRDLLIFPTLLFYSELAFGRKGN